MATSSHSVTTDFGEKPDPKPQNQTVLEWTPTGTGTSSGEVQAGVFYILANIPYGFPYCSLTVAGSTHDPCDSEVYMGPNPFSEVELINVRDYLQELSPVPILALAIHSEAQMMLTPYGYTHPPVYPPNIDEIVSCILDQIPYNIFI